MPRSPTVRVVVLLLALPWTALSTSLFMLDTAVNKCFKVDVTSDMVLIVDFEAPDLKDDDGNDAQRRTLSGADGDEEPKLGEEGLDSRYNQRDRRKRNRLPDMLLQMNHLMEENGRRRSAGANKRGTRKLREDLDAATGRLEFLTGDRDGFVEICVQAYTATKSEPRRFGMKITKMTVGEYQREKESRRIAEQSKVQVPLKQETEMLVKVETSRITTELERFTKRIQDISGNAAASKDRQASFQQTSLSLSRAVRRYPIFRIGILLVAGYMQASHVVKYMRSRHIY